MRLAFAALVALGIGLPALSRAQSFGPYCSAEILPLDSHAAGFYVHGSGSTTGLLSQLRLSFYPGIDFGFQGGLARYDRSGNDKTLLQVGADIRFATLRVNQGAPVDLALGGGFGIDVGDDISLLSLGPMAFVSRTYPAGTGSIAPYAVAGLSFSTASAGAVNRNDVYVPFNLGAEYRPNPVVSVAVEAQVRFGDRFRDDLGLGVGVTFPF